MSKVLVDRGLLERIARDDEGLASLADFEELKRVLAQQAEQQPVLPVESEAWLQEWARGKFTNTGAYKPRALGQLYGNTDWALARALHSAIVSQLAAPIAQNALEPERWHAMCGDWRETSVAIHGERSGHIACGIPEDKAHAIIKAHNVGLPGECAALSTQGGDKSC